MAYIDHKSSSWVVCKHIGLIHAMNHANGAKGWWSLKSVYFGGAVNTMEYWAGAL